MAIGQPTHEGDNGYRMPQRIQNLFVWAPFLIGVLSLIGTIFDWPLLITWWTGLPSQPPVAAVCTILLALALVWSRKSRISGFLSGASAILASESLAIVLFAPDQISWRWLSEPLAARSMSVTAGAMFLLSSASLLMSAAKRLPTLAQLLAAGALCMGLIELGIPLVQPMAVDSAAFRSASLPTIVAIASIALAQLARLRDDLTALLPNPGWPLRHWLALYAIAIAVPLVLASSLALLRLAEADYRTAKLDLERQGDLVAAIVARYLEDTQRLAAILAKLAGEAVEQPARFSALAQPIASELASHQALLLTVEGRILSNFGGHYSASGASFSDMQGLHRATRMQAAVLGNTTSIESPGEATFYAIAPIINGDDTRGAVAVGVATSDLKALLVGLGLQPDRAAVVFDGDGRPVAASRENPGIVKLVVASSLDRELLGQDRGPLAFQSAEGQPFSGYIVRFPGTGWSSAVAMIQATPLSHQTSSINFAILLAFSALTLAIVSAIFLGRELSRQFSSLVASAAAIGTGAVVRTPSTGILELDATADAIAQSDRLIANQSRELGLSEARYRSLVEDQSELVCRFKNEGLLTFANASFARTFGISQENLAQSSVFDAMPPLEADSMRDTIARLGPEFPAATVTAHIVDPAGELRTIEWSLRHIGIDSNQTIKYQAIGRDITEREHMDRALRASRERMQLAFRAGRACAWEWDVKSNHTTWSEECKDLLGYEPDALRSGFVDLLAFAHASDRDRVQAELAKAQAAGGPFNIEFRVRRLDGAYIWLGMSGKVNSGAGASPLTATGLIQDITERRQREERIDQLMQEVSHRAKNMLAVVQAVARQTATTQASEFVPRFVERLHSLAASLDLLVRSAWKGIAVADLVKAQLAHLSDVTGGQIAMSGPPLELTAAAGQTLGMALHELATNASKYGALSSAAGGKIEITWAVEPYGNSSRFVMSWIEQASREITPPLRRGFGTTVIVDMVKLGLSADVDLDFHREGMRWRMTCPIAAVSGNDQEHAAPTTH